MDLIADIGGTHTRCALATGGRIARVRVMRNREFASLEDVLQDYLRAVGQPALEDAALAVAAPVLGDRVRMVNLHWQFSRAALARRLKVRRLLLTNDFSALAWSLLRLKKQDLSPIHTTAAAASAPPAKAARHAPRIVLGPGTGLGCGILVACANDAWTTLPGEGGHTTLAAADDAEAQVIARARARLGHVSAERLVSGPGLALLYQILSEMAGNSADPQISPRDVSKRADSGDPVAGEAQDMFFRMLATVASNLALSVGALGGVYIAGGIVPQQLPAFRASDFRRRFEDKGRFREYLSRIPVWVITREQPALLGLVELLARNRSLAHSLGAGDPARTPPAGESP